MEGTRRAAEHRLLRAKNNSPTNRGIVHDQTSAMRAGSRDARSRCLEKFDGVQFQHPVILKNLRSLLYSGSLIICTSGMPVTSCSNADRDNGGSYVTSKLQTLDSPVSLVGCVLPNFMQSVQKPGGVLRSINTHSTDVPQRSQPNIKSDHCSPSRRVAESTPPNRVCLTECRILQSCSECTEEHIADFFSRSTSNGCSRSSTTLANVSTSEYFRKPSCATRVFLMLCGIHTTYAPAPIISAGHD